MSAGTTPDLFDHCSIFDEYLDCLKGPVASDGSWDEEKMQQIFDDFHLMEDLRLSPYSSDLSSGSSPFSTPQSSPQDAAMPSPDSPCDESFDSNEWLIYDESTGKARPPKLLEFLHLLLDNPRYRSYAAWLNKESGVFRIYRPDNVTSLWRQVKLRRTNGSMNYDTFARGIRYYYKSGSMLKTHTKHTYCFAPVQHSPKNMH